jgi:hypothetical protein
MSYRVRDVLEAVQDAAPAPHTTADDIIARGRRMRTRRTAITASGAAAAFVTVVVAAVAGVGGRGDEVPAAPSPAPVLKLAVGFTTTFGESRVGPYRIGPAGEVTAAYQEIPVYRDGETWPGDDHKDYPLVDGMITVYQPGVYDARRLGTSESGVTLGAEFTASVGGRPGVGREMTYAMGGQKYGRTALAWQYASNAWATYVPRPLRIIEAGGSRQTEDALQIAEALTTAPKRAIRVPYRIGFLPDGWQTVAVTETPAAISTSVSEVFLHDGPLPKSPQVVDEVLPKSAKITVLRGDLKDDKISGKKGVHCYTQPTCIVVLGQYSIMVESLSTELSPADIEQIAKGLEPVEVADRAAWLPVRN